MIKYVVIKLSLYVSINRCINIDLSYLDTALKNTDCLTFPLHVLSYLSCLFYYRFIF